MFDEILTPKNIKIGLLVVLVLLVGYALMTRKEGLIGGGITDQVFTSGATQRRLGQEFSMPSQGTYTTMHIDNLKELVPHALSGKEGLVSTRGEPDFWNINRSLEDYKASQVAPMAADAAADLASAGTASGISTGVSEGYTAGSLKQVEDALLRNQLYG